MTPWPFQYSRFFWGGVQALLSYLFAWVRAETAIETAIGIAIEIGLEIANGAEIPIRAPA
jgi:hypothetical protein